MMIADRGLRVTGLFQLVKNCKSKFLLLESSIWDPI